MCERVSVRLCVRVCKSESVCVCVCVRVRVRVFDFIFFYVTMWCKENVVMIIMK